MASRKPLVLGPDGRSRVIQSGDTVDPTTLPTLLYDRLSQLTAAETTVTAAFTDLSVSPAYGRAYVFSTAASAAVILPTAVGSAGKCLSFRVATGATGFAALNGYPDTPPVQTVAGRLGPQRLFAGESVTLLSDGANWVTVASSLRPLSCRRYLTASQSLVANTDARLPLGTTDHDSSGLMAGVGAAANGIEIVRAGRYWLTPKVQAGNPATATTLNAYVNLNRTTASISAGVVAFTNLPFPAFQYGAATYSQPVSLVVGDYLHLGATAGVAMGCDPGVRGCSLEVAEDLNW